MIIPKNSKDVAGFRDFFTTVRSQACSMAGTYVGPLKQVWEDLVAKFDAAIAALPANADGSWDASSTADCFFNCLASANAVASQLALELSKMQGTMATAATDEVNRLVTAGELFRKADVTAQVEAGVTAKITEGFVAKATSSQLCSEAKLLGITEGKAAMQAELTAAAARQTLITNRSAALTSAGVPLPDAEVEKILGGTEEEFNAAKTLFETRKAALKADGITLASSPLVGKLWASEDRYKEFLAIVKDIPALKVSPEPLAPASPVAEPAKAARFVV